MKYLGLDLGTRTLGISKSDITGTIATTYKTIRFNDSNYIELIPELTKIIEEEKIDKIVLGLPKNMNNTLGERAEISLNFKELIENNLNVKVTLVDERLTTVISNNIMIKADVSRKKRKKKVDALAAQVILQSYLDRTGE